MCRRILPTIENGHQQWDTLEISAALRRAERDSPQFIPKKVFCRSPHACDTAAMKRRSCSSRHKRIFPFLENSFEVVEMQVDCSFFLFQVTGYSTHPAGCLFPCPGNNPGCEERETALAQRCTWKFYRGEKSRLRGGEEAAWYL